MSMTAVNRLSIFKYIFLLKIKGKKKGAESTVRDGGLTASQMQQRLIFGLTEPEALSAHQDRNFFHFSIFFLFSKMKLFLIKKVVYIGIMKRRFNKENFIL